MSSALNVGELVAYLRLDTSELDKAPQTISRALGQAGPAAGAAAGRVGTQIAAGLTGALTQVGTRVAQQGNQAGARYGAGITAGINGATRDAAGRFARAGTQMGTAAAPGVQRGIQDGITGATRDARGRFIRAGTQMGAAAAPGVQRGIQGAVNAGANGAASSGQRAGSKFGVAFAAIAGSAIGTAIGEHAGEIFGKAKELMFGAQDASVKLSAQLALTADEAARFGKDASTLFSGNFAGSIDEANEALKSVILNIGGMRSASDKDLTAITGQVSELAQTFGVDLNDATIAVGQMMKTGLAPNAQSALDIITAGFQHGDDKAGDFLDTLNEYGVQFQKLGIDGTTATGLLSQGLQAGARDADLVADALKEFSIRAVDGSTTTAAGFTALGLNVKSTSEAIARGGKDASAATQDVLQKMDAIVDPVQRAAIATELFGTQSEDLGKALFSLNLDTAAKGLGDVAGASQLVTDKMGSTASGAITSFVQSLESVGQSLGQTILPLLQPLLTDLGKVGSAASGAASGFQALPQPLQNTVLAFGAIVLVGPKLLSMVGTLATKFGQLGGATTGLKGSFGALGKMLAGGAMFAGIAYIVDSWSSSMQRAKQFNDGVRASVKQVSDALVDSSGKWDANAQAALKSAVTGSQDFQDLLKAGVSYGDAMDLVHGKTENIARAMDKVKNAGGIDKERSLELQFYLASLTQFVPKAEAAAAAEKKYNDEQANQAQILAGSKSQQDTYVDRLQAAGKAQQELTNGSAATVAGIASIGDAFTAASGKQRAAADSAAADAGSGFKDFALSVDRGSKAAGAGAGSISAMSDSFVALTPHARDAAAAQGSWNRLMIDAQGVTDAETASLALFSFSVDQMSGKNRTAEEATKNLNDQVRNIGAAFKDGTDATHGNIESLITASGAIDTTTEAGSKLYDSLNNYRTAADQSTDSAYESAVAAGNQAGALGLAKKAADDARAKFLAQAEALGINKTAAEKMADQLGILEGQKLTDKNFDINAKDNASGPLGAVKGQIDGLKDKTVTVTVNTQGQSVTARSDGSFTSGAGTGGFATGGLVSGPGTGTSDSIVTRLSNGEGVNTAAAMQHRENVAAMHFMNRGGVIPGFANGGLINVDMTASGNINGALSAVQTIFGHADSSASKINAAAKAAAERAAAIPAASSGVEQWVPLMTRVITEKLGAAAVASVLPVMKAQMQNESGGNPRAINLTDSNAQAGHPSVGLLQFIPTTFAANADPGYGSNIYDPESQMRAFINYVPRNYGSFDYLTRHGNGAYATGDLVRGPGSGTSDSIVARVSNGEGINTASAMSKPANVAAMRFMNAGGVIPGFAAGGLVSPQALAGYAAPQYGERRSAVNSGIDGMTQALQAEWDRVNEKRQAAAAAYDAVDRARDSRAQARGKAEIKAADAAVKAALLARKNADTQYTAEKRNAAAAAATQKQLAGVYHNLQAAGSRYDQLTGRLDAARSSLAEKQSTLAGTRANKAQAVAGYASSIAGFDGGLTGHSDVRGTSGSVVGGLRYDLGKITSFYNDLASLRKKGAPLQILQELTGQFGSGGEITAHALNSGPIGDLRAAAALQGQINQVAGMAGSIAPSLQYDGQIKAQQADIARTSSNIATLTKAVADTNKQLLLNANTIETRLLAALRTGVHVDIDGKSVLMAIDPHVQAAVDKKKGQG